MKPTTIFYDAGCAFCTRWARQGERLGFRIEPFANGAAESELQVTTPAGRTLGGAKAIGFLCRQVWWLGPVGWLCGLPGAELIYRWVAANRYCWNGGCAVGSERQSAKTSAHSKWALLLPVVVGFSQPDLPAWVFMWLMVATLLAGMMAWSGWRPRLEWSGDGGGNFLIGAVLFWGVARWLPVGQGWVGMLGLVLMGHFGVVQCVTRLMDAPLRAKSVSEFWSRRWNRAFPAMMRPMVFEPVARRWGAVAGTWAVFGVSGVLHELVISLPAGGGYGLPTLYFLIQAAGIRVRSRGMAWVVVAGPVFGLFHPLFVNRVIEPMMEAMGAL